MLRRLLPLALAAGLVAAPGAHAQGAPSAQRSPNVTRTATLSEPGVVSVRPRGDHLFVSGVAGLSVYDVRDPRAPVPVSRLALPVAQNEDVDLGGDILLMSDEPAIGGGRLHVVDISDPARPVEISTYDTWAPGLLADLEGRDRRRPSRGGIGHTVTCIHDCRWAYLAGSDAGIEIVDLRDPRNPRFAGRFAARETAYGIGTHDVQVDGSGLAWIAGGGGTAAYDVRDPVHPRLVFRTGRSARGPSLRRLLDGPATPGRRVNDMLHHNSLRLPNGSLAAPPPGDPRAPSDVVAVTEEDLYRPRCRGAGTFETWRIGAGGILRHLDSWRVERDPGARIACSAHYFDERDGLVAQGWFEQGVRFLDVRRPGDVRQVGWWVPRRTMAWGAVFAPTDPSGQTVFAVDHRRGIDVLAVDRGRLTPVRRRAPRRRAARNASVFVDDRRDVVRPGGRVSLEIGVVSEGRPPARGTRAVLQLPEQAVSVRMSRGGRLLRGSRRILFPVSSRAEATVLAVEVTLARDAPRGPLLFEARLARNAGDAMPTDDRFVDRDLIAPRARASVARRATPSWSCRLPTAGSPLRASARRPPAPVGAPVLLRRR